jgi:hypothetical protein
MTHGRSWLTLALVLLLLVAVTAAPAAAQTRFVFANESPYDTMDPHAAFDVGRVAVRLNLYDGLYRWLDNPPKLEPWLAESHAVSPDGLTYTFKLRKGAKFHDGTEITAEDASSSSRSREVRTMSAECSARASWRSRASFCAFSRSLASSLPSTSARGGRAKRRSTVSRSVAGVSSTAMPGPTVNSLPARSTGSPSHANAAIHS